MTKTSVSTDSTRKDPVNLQAGQMNKKKTNPKKNEILKQKGMPKDLRQAI